MVAIDRVALYWPVRRRKGPGAHAPDHSSHRTRTAGSGATL